MEDARRFTYQSMCIKSGQTSYSVAKKHKWVSEACAHMTSPKVAMGHWTLEALKSDALQYVTKVEWKKASASAYATATQKGLIAECCAHMVESKKPAGFWTKLRCSNSAQQFTTIQSWALGDPPGAPIFSSKGVNSLKLSRKKSRIWACGQRSAWLKMRRSTHRRSNG